MAAMIAKEWLQVGEVDHVVIIAPWKTVVASVQKACDEMSLTTYRSLFVSASGYTSPPGWEVTVLTTQAGCSKKTAEALRQWSGRHGLRFGVIIDEIHHNAEGGVWGEYASLIAENATRVVVMSGTPFRSDGMPIALLNYRGGQVAADFSLSYTQGVSEGYVRNVTTSWISGNARVVDCESGDVVEKDFSQLTAAEVKDIQNDLFDPRGELVRATIEAVHSDLMRIRQAEAYKNAAALFVCRPGTNNGESDRRVYQIANRVKALTGVDPVVVTHKDSDAEGKIEAFRRGSSPYIVAVNMISEGCDIPRLVSVGLLRLIASPMLVRQVVGRVIRRQGTWDDIAANVYAPRIDPMAAELSRLYEEGAAGMELRQPCSKCKSLPCTCVRWCQHCGNYECDCPKCGECHRKVWQCACEKDNRFAFVDAEAETQGGYFVDTEIQESYVAKAREVAFRNLGFRGVNAVFHGAFLQAAGLELQEFNTNASPEQHRRRLIDKAERLNRRLASLAFNKNEKWSFAEEITPRFSVEDFTEAKAKLTLEEAKRMVDHLTHKVEGALR
jgi:superfamily II DNA or RNA helicase